MKLILLRTRMICCVCALALYAATPIQAAGDPPATHPHTMEELRAAGWRLPPMRYPRIASVQYEQGSGVIEIFTDATGKVARAAMIKKIGFQSLDGGLVDWALEAWKGPPNSRARIGWTFRMY